MNPGQRRAAHLRLREEQFAVWRERWLAERPPMEAIDRLAERTIGRDAWHRAVWQANRRDERLRDRTCARRSSVVVRLRRAYSRRRR